MKMIRGAVLCVALFDLTFSLGIAQQPDGGLAGLYQVIADGFANGHPPKLVEVTNYLNKVPGMSGEEIRSGLPAIEKAIQSPRMEVRSYGFIGLFAINLRPDSRSLIEPLVPTISRSLNDPDKHIRIGAFSALLQMKPKPPESAISYGLRALRSDKELGPGIVFELVQIDPNRDDIASAIATYMTSQMTTSEERVGTLHALATRPVQDKRLITLIASNLTGQPEDVQIAAIRAIESSGPTGVETVRLQLQQITESSEASERLRSAAKKALEPSH